MNLGLISDTHDRIEVALAALRFFKQLKVEVVIHVGDWTTPQSFEQIEEVAQALQVPMKTVLGNNDQELRTIFESTKDFAKWIEVPDGDVLEMNADGLPICVYHGHDKVILDALIKSGKYQVLIKGHSHKVEQTEKGSVLIINPGSTAFALPRRKDYVATIATFNTQEKRVTFFTYQGSQFQPFSP